jgi:hypothetical protein
LFTHLSLDLPCGLFPSGFPTNILYTFVSLIRATWPSHLILLDLIKSNENINIKFNGLFLLSAAQRVILAHTNAV